MWGKEWGKGWGKEKWCNGTQGGTQGGTQDGTQDGTQSGTQDDTEGDTQMIPKNKLLPSSTIQYLPKTKLGSLLITSKTPPGVWEKNFSAFLKSYVQYILCIYVYMYSRIHEYTFQPISARQQLWSGLPHSPHICLYRLSYRLWSGSYLHLAWWEPWLCTWHGVYPNPGCRSEYQ